MPFICSYKICFFNEIIKKERINLINKRIHNEKEKIFELKLQIENTNLHLQSMQTTGDPQQYNASKKSIDLHLINKIHLTDNKELVMTKL